jgi:Tfp pilus assembly protein PilX
MRHNSMPARCGSHRRGFAVATVVVLLLLLNIVAFGSVRSGSDESAVASLRVETLRALYACDAGLVVTLGELGRGEEMPADERTLELEGATAVIAPGTVEGELEILIVGSSGYGRRRVVVEVADSN